MSQEMRGKLMLQINQGSSNTFGLAWVWKVRCFSLLNVFVVRREMLGVGPDSVLISRKNTTIDPAYSHTPTPTSRMQAARRQI
jgi:hypothetical protein